MKKFIRLFSVFVFSLSGLKSQGIAERPRLVVGIVVDQMRQDYLYRFYEGFSDDGFKRLIDGGFVFHNMHYNYVPTYTGPGHASIYTGATPAVHGILANDWYERDARKKVYCTEDVQRHLVGVGDEHEGQMSPKSLQTTTITDELKLATNFRSKVIAISLKTRGSILPVGHFADAAYWLSKTGNFITSSFYMTDLPAWVKSFNDKKHYMDYIRQGWSLMKKPEAYKESILDDNPYETKLPGKATPTFPYDLQKAAELKGVDIIRSTPFGNDLLIGMAKAAIENEKLGSGETTDFLSVSFSSTDYIGHAMAPRSVEVQDTYLRLDRGLADLLSFLDKKVGKGEYLVFLTADHAAADNPAYLKDRRYEVETLFDKSLSKTLRDFSVKTYGQDFVLDCANYNIFLDRVRIKELRLDEREVFRAFKELLMKQKPVMRVYTGDELMSVSSTDRYAQMLLKGFDPMRSGDMVFLTRPGFVPSYSFLGTSHSSPFNYDTHVPLIWYGWKVPKGESHKKVSITQIAPTLSQKLHIAFPNGSENDALEEVLPARR